MAPNSLVSEIQRPELSKPGRDSALQFKEQYDEYARLIDSFNASRTPANRLTKATIRECVKVDLLENLIMTGLIANVEDVAELTEEQFLAWFESVLAKEPTNLGDKVAEVIRKHKHVPNTKDPEAGVQEYVFNVMTDLRALGGARFMRDKSQAKNVINRLALGLRPREVKDLLFRDKSMWKDNEHTSISHFILRAGDIATQVQRLEEIRPTRDEDSVKPKNKRREGGTSGSSKRQQDGGDHGKRRRMDHAQKGVWNRPCLNTKCTGRHKIEDCPITPDQDKRRLLDEHIAKLRQQRQQKAAGKGVRLKPGQNELEVRIGDVPMIGRDDTGADVTIIPERVAEMISSQPNGPELRELDVPVEVELAVQQKDAPSVLAKHEVTTSVTIIVPGSRLPVKIRNVCLLVAEGEMGTALIGRDVLDKLGFTFRSYLQDNYEKIKDTDAGDKAFKCAYAGVVYGDVDDDPVTPEFDLSAQFGDDDEEDIKNALEERVANAREKGLSANGVRRLREILRRRMGCFGIKLGTQPPAKIEPFNVRLKPGSTPKRACQRRYGPVQQRFIEETVKNLERIGAVYRNPHARWASPALAVPKPGTNQLRFTVDLRAINSVTMTIQSGMPHLESHLQQCSGSKAFANLDLCHGFWQIPLARESQEIMSIMTHNGIYSPTRTLQGGSDSACYFHDVTSQKFEGRVDNIVQWIDDYLLHEEDEDDLLDSLDKFLEVCEQENMRVHAVKSQFFAKEARFCGRIMSNGQVRYDPRNLQALVDMKPPQRANELQQLLCASNWMRSSIPSYAELVAPMHRSLEAASAGLKKKTKRALERIDITPYWHSDQQQSFDKLKSSLASSTSLSYPKEGHAICLFTDASSSYWSAILMQCPVEQMNTAIMERQFEPLAFLSGAFKGSAINWSTPEKEGYAIVESMTRMDYLTLGREIHIYTDHANLLTMYDPIGVSSPIPRYAVNKLMRWATRLSAFNYTVEHVPGELNVWADMLSRWANYENDTVTATKIQAKSLMLAPISPSLKDEFEWPSPADIINVQPRRRPRGEWELINKVWTDKSGAIFIPSDDELLKTRLLVAAHAGMAGHRAKEVTYNNLKGRFWWQGMEKEVDAFTKSCLHCMSADSRTAVPRPLGTALHASKPNEILHFDYCFMGKSTTDVEYVLIMKDDLTSYTWLMPVANIDALSTADCLLKWFAAFGVVHTWISDQGTHFLNETVAEIRDRTKSNHHFTLPYCPWSNGTVEVVCRELKKTTKAILDEFRLPSSNWNSTLPLVQSALNNAATRRLGNKCPLTLFTGQRRDDPVCAIVTKHGTATRVHNIEQTRLEALVNVEKMHEQLADIHRETAESTALRRRQSVQSHNTRTGVRPVNFGVGDFVLKAEARRGRKLKLTWLGPYRVVKCLSEYLFEVEDLLTGEHVVSHGRRLKLFRNSDFAVTEDVLHHLEYQKGELLVIEAFDDIRENGEAVECLVKWKGFDQHENDWVPVSTLQEDVPDLLREFLSDTAKNGTKRQRQIAGRLL